MRRDVLIWWTDSDEAEDADIRAGAPRYIGEQLRSRRGRAGRGRLWAATTFGNVAVDPWPDSPFAENLAANYGGVVIWAPDRRYVEREPGMLTDLALNRVDVVPKRQRSIGLRALQRLLAAFN